jgi:hypothetical protein
MPYNEPQPKEKLMDENTNQTTDTETKRDLTKIKKIGTYVAAGIGIFVVSALIGNAVGKGITPETPES